MARLDLKIEGPPGTIAASVLATALANSVSILRDLASAITPRKAQVTWFVEYLRTDSARVGLLSKPRADVEEADLGRITLAYVDGLRVIEEGNVLPEYLSEKSLDRVKKITRPLVGVVSAFSVTADLDGGATTSVTVTHKAADNVVRLMRPESRGLGSVTGRLEAVNLHGTRPKFNIYDELTRRPVSGYFDQGSLEAVREALGKRMRLSGMVIRNAKGQPIRVEDPELASLAEVRSLTELVGLDPGFIGDQTLTQYMEEHVG